MATVCEWEPGTWYGAGTIVVYQGVRYKIIQPHTSEPGWEPPATPALWGRMQEEVGGGYGGGYQSPPPQQQQQQQPPCDSGYGGGGGYNPGYIQPGAQPQYQPPPQPQCQPPPPQQQYQAPPPCPPPSQGGGDEKQWDQHQEQQVQIHHEERKKSWFDLEPERKKQLEIGGGLVAGLAAVGAGYYAYHSHQKGEEEKKAQVWALQNWLHEAQARTQQYYQNGPRGPVTWVLTEGKNIPNGAIPGGEQNGQALYICRGFHEGGLQIGKVSAAFENSAVVGYAHKEIHLPKYEVLVGDQRAVQWVDARGRLNLHHLGARPVEGGHEANGTPLFIAKAHHHNAVIPGKASEKLDGAFVTFRSSEVEVKDYRVLCYV
ncbi:hypothetical protein AcV5_007557 [Taiwanofungus camphoratus]|nr:hypothetical protein AcW2_007214 [Antrodia cinnamomea]KAI0926878.1 hypothetical protein AcV5_007557 [Antrodia cinnamomea]